MTRFVCRSCGATWLNEPAESLAGRHDGRCLRCEGRLEQESENERIVRQHFAALNDYDDDALAATLDPGVTIRPPFAEAGGQPSVMRGLSSVIGGFRTVRQRFAGWSCTVHAIQEHPEGRVVCDGSIIVVRLDGSSEAREVSWAIRMRDGRVVELTGFDSQEAALEALDLSVG